MSTPTLEEALAMTPEHIRLLSQTLVRLHLVLRTKNEPSTPSPCTSGIYVNRRIQFVRSRLQLAQSLIADSKRSYETGLMSKDEYNDFYPKILDDLDELEREEKLSSAKEDSSRRISPTAS